MRRTTASQIRAADQNKTTEHNHSTERKHPKEKVGRHGNSKAYQRALKLKLHSGSTMPNVPPPLPPPTPLHPQAAKPNVLFSAPHMPPRPGTAPSEGEALTACTTGGTKLSTIAE